MQGVRGFFMFYEKSDMIRTINKIIICARTGDHGTASSLMNQFLILLQADISKGKIQASGLSKITFSLETMMEVQRTEDWVAVADVLEYEFIPLWKVLSS
jgi:hypothetical protein